MTVKKSETDQWLDHSPNGLKVSEDLGIAWENMDSAITAPDLGLMEEHASEAIRSLRRVVSAIHRERKSKRPGLGL